MQATLHGRPRCRPAPAAGLCAALAILPVLSLAGVPADLPQWRVSLADLDLGNPKDVATAYSRLHWAAVQVCPLADSSNYWLRVSAQPCVATAVRRAVERIGAPLLTAYELKESPHALQHAQMPSSSWVR